MKIKCLFLIVLLSAVSYAAFAQSAGSVRRIGVFTNMKYTREHQYGFSVELWREKDRFFGLFRSAEGLAGDTPAGLLEDVMFDQKTGRLSFRSRLSTGITFNKNDESVPARDVYRFTGSLKGRRLTGVLEHTNALDSAARGGRTKISLKRSRNETDSMSKAKSYDEWKKEADKILKFRGPKW